MNKWTHRFMQRAKDVAAWSKDPKHKVGAIIVDQHNHVISEGYNGPPRGIEDEDLSKEMLRLRSLHAEQNAILHGVNRDMKGAIMYIHPFIPCATCAAMIIQVGIKRVIFNRLQFTNAWAKSQTEALQMFKEAKVEFHVYN